MIFRLIDKSVDGSASVLAEAEFDDPQEGLRWLWDAAEQTDHDAGELAGETDGLEITL